MASALLQYDGDTWRADQVLADFGTYYPGATNDDYEIAGFFWWQVRVCECVCTPIMGSMVTDRWLTD